MFKKFRGTVIVLLILLLAACTTTSSPPVQDSLSSSLEPLARGTIRLNPISYTTKRGSDGGQAVSRLAVKDQQGTENDWDKYVEFISTSRPYIGNQDFKVPRSVNLNEKGN